MTDLELLELAAKAAGIKLLDWRDQWADYNGPAWRTTERELWDPLTDDGDALRLAVKLRLDVEWLDSSTVFVESAQHVANDDPYAATRRAIVRAAAEIGKAL